MIEHLRAANVEILGRHPQASNAAFVVSCEHGDTSVRALYKPASGERHLWDFPNAVLGLREVAAYALAEALGLPFIPPTIWRDDLPLGPGSLQLWIDDASLADVEVVTEAAEGWLHVLDAELQDGTEVQVVHRDLPELRMLAFLDLLLNNADRKAGHMLRDAGGALWAVDHGVTFHSEPKLRTVLWGFAGQPIQSDLLQRLDPQLLAIDAVEAALIPLELKALEQRMRAVATMGMYPSPTHWPAIPWPIY